MVRPDYTIHLERLFQGPMDLLLHLVREQEVEIQDIEISKILEGYLAYLGELEKLDLEVAAEFLVMAATLMAIKSRSLLPTEEIDLADELDPKDELIQRLIEYRRFKGAADHLEDLHRVRSLQRLRGRHHELGDLEVEREFDLGDLTPFDLATTYARLMRETLADAPHQVQGDPRPLRFYVETVVGRLKGAGRLSLQDLVGSFDGVTEKEAIVGSFCALLELVKMQVVSIEQDGTCADIHVAVADDLEGDLSEAVATITLDDEVEDEEETPAAEAVEGSTLPFDGQEAPEGAPDGQESTEAEGADDGPEVTPEAAADGDPRAEAALPEGSTDDVDPELAAELEEETAEGDEPIVELRPQPPGETP